MNQKSQKQKQKADAQRTKKASKHKNPYNINISFNINNPKKVISNQISKTIKINHYSNEQQPTARGMKSSVSKVLNSTTKNHSASLPKSKEFPKYQCHLENAQGLNRRGKKSKSKTYDLQTKSKSDFAYHTSILNMPFPGDDPMPQLAVKKLNKMKKYFLQKIGSMDITETCEQPTPKISNQGINMRSLDMKYAQPKQIQSQVLNKCQDDDVMTEKLSEYQYENLISYEMENQNEENKTDSIMKDQGLFDYQLNEQFPRIVIDSMNSMSIKNEYLRHHSKFLSDNIKFFQNGHSDLKNHKKFQKNKNQSLDFSTDALKSKLLYQVQVPKIQQKQSKKLSRQFKANSSYQKRLNQSKQLKDKIKIIHQFLLKTDSSQSILGGNQSKNGKSEVGSLQDRSKIEEHYSKNPKKQYVIKTEIGLPNDLLNEIKQFESKQCKPIEIPKPEQGKSLNSTKLKQESLCEPRVSFAEFLKQRSQSGDKKETNRLIQNYIDLLNQDEFFQKQMEDKSLLKEISSLQQLQYITSQRSQKSPIHRQSSEGQVSRISDLKFNDGNSVPSQVSSYICGGREQDDSGDQSQGYSAQRNQKIEIEKRMKNELIQRLHSHQKTPPSQELKFVKNSVDLVEREHKKYPNLQNSLSQSSSKLLQSSSQNVYNNQQQNSYPPLQIAPTKNKQESNVNTDYNQQVESLLGFIKQNINFHSTDKNILNNLYQKIIAVTNNQHYTTSQKLLPTYTKLQTERVTGDKKDEESAESQKIQEEDKKSSTVITPKKDTTTVRGNHFHKRSYTTHKETNKLQESFISSDDLNLWDLILIEEKLNKKYNEITYEKQKRLFFIQSDPNLASSQCQDKINSLLEWENEAKRQVLQTKKQINEGIESLRKIVTPNSQYIGFKMKSFSQKILIPKFSFNTINQIEINPAPKQSLQIDQQKIKPKVQEIVQQSDKQANYKQIQHILASVSPKLAVNLEQILIQDSDDQPQAEDTFQHQNQLDQDQGETSPQHIKLSRTDNCKQLTRRDDSSSMGSQMQSDSEDQDNRRMQKLQENQEKNKELFGLMKNQTYQMRHHDQLEKESPLKLQEQYLTKHNVQSDEKNKASLLISKAIEQDKSEICQFILIDLCIELYQQALDVEDQDLKKGKYQTKSAHRILNDIFTWIKKEKKKPKPKQPKIGIYTELSIVKEYVQKIKNYIQSLQQRDKRLVKTDSKLLLNRLNSPIGPTASQILKTMRFYEDQTFQLRQQQTPEEFAQTDGLNSLILPVYVFTDFEEQIKNQKEFVFAKHFEDLKKEKNRLAFLKNVTHVHHKAIFDALNEMLDFQRPFGIWGKPFPWKKKNANQKLMDDDELKVALKNSSTKVVECAMYMCGLLVDKEESLIKNTTVSEAYIEQIKEDRMSKMIINDFLENENRFYFLDDEETEILLETSYVVWILLIQEAIKQFQPIMDRIL